MHHAVWGWVIGRIVRNVARGMGFGQAFPSRQRMRRAIPGVAGTMTIHTQDSLYLDPSRQASPQVFEQLRRMIINMDYPPGTVLVRAELMANFGVSQTPIRDALLKLAEEELVDIFPQHATVVSKIDTTKALQEHFLRLAVELEVVEMLATSSVQDFVEPLEQILQRQHKALEARDLTTFSAEDMNFHERMCEAAGVQRLWQLVRSRSGHVARLRRLHLPEGDKATVILSNHHEVLRAIQRRMPHLAREALRHHLSGTLSQLDTIRERHPEYMR